MLKAAAPYELAYVATIYTRGQAYLEARSGIEAAAEFQNILNHRGSQPTSPIYSFAYLGLARAAALSNDTAKARDAYQHFFGEWKDADSDLRVLQESKKEYENL